MALINRGMFFLSRECVCGKPISIKRQLCGECLESYGSDKNKWPEWLKWAVNDTQRVINAERRHDEITIFNDEYFLPKRIRKTKPRFDRDFEDMFWSNQ
ncbi:MAG TPA: hypothetical protein PKI51_06170 [Anaerolineaceae bacterium]|nr:hypothetical protein [Anaerolineaceae bacterium]